MNNIKDTLLSKVATSAADVAVLLPTYAGNSFEEYEIAFNSILGQSKQSLDFINVIDGPLPEKFREQILSICNRYIDRFVNLTVVQLEKNQGLGSALNCGFSLCRAPLIARFDCDDFSIVDRIKIQEDIFTLNPTIGISSSYVSEHEDLEKPTMRIKNCALTFEEAKNDYWIKNPINHPSAMIRLKSLEGITIDTDINFHEDYLLWAQIFQNGWKYIGSNSPLVKMKVDENMHGRRGGDESIAACDEAGIAMVFTGERHFRH
jgi:glycosyltransferase involved in cell wall biosynthesis